MLSANSNALKIFATRFFALFVLACLATPVSAKLLGLPYERIYAGSDPELLPTRQLYLNNKGQIVRAKDPDGVHEAHRKQQDGNPQHRPRELHLHSNLCNLDCDWRHMSRKHANVPERAKWRRESANRKSIQAQQKRKTFRDPLCSPWLIDFRSFFAAHLDGGGI
jgi:hypothetical protein